VVVIPEDPFFNLISSFVSSKRLLFGSFPCQLGAAIMAQCSSERYQVKACSSPPLHQVQSTQRQHHQMIPPFTVVSPDRSQRKRIFFSPTKLGAAISEHCRSERYQVKDCCSLPLSQVQLINWSQLQEIHSSWSLHPSSAQNGCIFTPFPSTGSENCG